MEQEDIQENNGLNNLLQLNNKQSFNSIVGISDNLKFVVSYNLLRNYADEYSKASQIILVPSWKNCQYISRTQLEENSKQHTALKIFNEDIQQTIVFSLNSLYESEKRAKINFLWSNLDKIAEIFEASTESIYIGEIVEPKECIRQFKKNIFILLLGQKVDKNFQQVEILRKQILLNQFMVEKFVRRFQVYNIKKPKLSRLSLKQLSQEMMQQLNYSIQIKIGYEKYDFTSFEKNINIEIVQYDDSQAITNSFIKEFQDRAQNIQRASLQEKRVFQEFVLKLPQFDKKDIKYKLTQEGIKFKGTHNLIKQIQAITQITIKSVKTQSIFLQMSKFVAEFVQYQDQQLPNTLTRLFMEVTHNAYLLNVVNIKNNIEVLVYLNENLNNDIVNLENILNKTLEQLKIIEISSEVLASLEITLQSFQKKYFAVVRKNGELYNCLMLQKYIDQVMVQMDSKKTLLHMHYKTQSKIYALQIIQDYQNHVIPQHKDIIRIKLADDNSTIQIECAVKNPEILVILEKHEKSLQAILKESQLNLSKMKCKYLIKYCQKELAVITEQCICDINFNLEDQYQTPTNTGDAGLQQVQKKSGSAFIQYGKKSVVFSKNLNTDFFLKFGQKHALDKKIIYIHAEKLAENVFGMKNFLNYYEKSNFQFKKIGILFDEVQILFPQILETFLKPEYTKANELLLFIDETKREKDCERQLVQVLAQSVSSSFQDYQWQWADGKQYFDYDDALVNEQIEIGYQNYLKKNSQNEAIIHFPCSYTPGTHTVDLNKQTILDHANGQVKSLKIKNGIYYIGAEQGDDIFNQYIQEKISQNKYQFPIFLKKYKILFKSPQEFFQANIDTGFKRRLKRVNKKDQYFQFIQDLTKNTLQIQETTIAPSEQKCCSIKYFEQNNDKYQLVQYEKSDIVCEAINLHLQKFLVDFDITIPLLNDQVFFNFLSFIEQNSIAIIGDIEPGAQISITSFYKNQLKIIEILQYFGYFPNDWSHLSYSNLYQLEQSSYEIQEINALIPYSEIKNVQNVQNFDIWMKYQKVKSSLQNQNEILLLYGNKNVHPQVEIARLILNLQTDKELGPYLRCGKDLNYVKENYCSTMKGEKQIIICQVLIGNPIELKQEYVISENSKENYLSDDLFLIKRNRIYPKYIVTL